MANLSNLFMGQPESSQIVTSSAFQPARSRCSPILTPLAYFLGQQLVVPAYFGAVEVIGQEHIPASGPIILAPTHRARWDSIILPLAAGRPVTGRDLRFMVSADEVKGATGMAYSPPGRVCRLNVKRPTISSLRHGIDLLIDQEMLVIYPEGDIFSRGSGPAFEAGSGPYCPPGRSCKTWLECKSSPGRICTMVRLTPAGGCPVQVYIGQPIAVKNYLNRPANAEAVKSAAKNPDPRSTDHSRTDGSTSTICSGHPSLHPLVDLAQSQGQAPNPAVYLWPQGHGLPWSVARCPGPVGRLSPAKPGCWSGCRYT